MQKIVIIGGGISGLTAAYLLAEKGNEVTIIEKKRHLGGRAFSFYDKDCNFGLDNGQHILMGCYKYTLQLLEKIESIKFLKFQDKLALTYIDTNCNKYFLQTNNFPAPLNILSGLNKLHLLNRRELLNLIIFGIHIYKYKLFKNIPKISVKEFLNLYNQSDTIQKYLWEPITLSALNSKPENVSAKLFVNTIYELFFKLKKNSRIIIPKVELNKIFTLPLQHIIQKMNGRFLLNSEVVNFQIENNSMRSVTLKDGTIVEGDIFISSIYFLDFLKINNISNIINHENIKKIKTSPIIGIYIYLKKQIFKEEIIVCINTKIQVLFNKSKICNYKNGTQLLSIVISAADVLIKKNIFEIKSLIIEEFFKLSPEFNEDLIISYKIIKEKNATPLFNIDIEELRPKIKTKIDNFYLIGDWIDTGLPATIESAVKSAYMLQKYIK